MNEIIKAQLTFIREGMLRESVEEVEKIAIHSMTDDELLVLIFENLFVAKGQEDYLLKCLMNKTS